jgi:RpiR family transcriptional regulator, carbohydrate utilization regulator
VTPSLPSIEDLRGRIQELVPTLRPAERRVAEAVLADQAFATRASNAELARRADVSEPTVTRFCRSIGCEGVRDFKLRLAQSLAAGTHQAPQPVRPEDDLSQLARKVVAGAAGALDSLLQGLDMDALRQAVELLGACGRLEIFGSGTGSGTVARDAHLRFARLDLGANVHMDGHLQLIAAAYADTDTAVLAISHTGRTRELIQAVKLARKGGARTLALTTPGSPLSRTCEVVLPVSVAESADLYVPSASRLAHLVLVDILVAAVALRRGPRVAENLRRIQAALAGSRLDPQVDPDLVFP